ncbi:SusC/RagA family TonB-linked outer membrane protein [Seonamhaeicola algicola]|uniref:SusC/RagA family TonB-linked outer membrane protein n=1 Tax=Seonamhaeicola algicola TaxID=1719036 RepID=A0A5C7AW88_9FLAO|nr:SusC/RagA family TonB-linked outer membrane protein [Seonamhaeicola algicola]TXE12731.1 SusC/RagA family TonB-linked outer membrane protein [Seonamhaeicola algicola]
MSKVLHFKMYLFVLLLFPITIFSQGKITGVVTDGANNLPLPGANVIVKGTTTGTTTDFDGNFSLNVQEFPVTLVFSSLGFEALEKVVKTSGVVNVTLKESATSLEEVVITGLASSTKRSNLANTVASISAGDLTGVTAQTEFGSSLSGKFTGAEIRANSGAPGGGISMRLRGVTSIFGNQQPLFIVDGVYVDNSSIGLGNNIVSEASGGGNTSSTQDDASNRIADIDPEDIESVEILKGASAAAIYGSRAAAGVVIIKTKRGKQGKPKVTFSQTVGFRSPTQLLGLRDWDADEITNLGGDPSIPLRDYEAEIFDHTRVSTTSRFTTSGANEKTDYFFGVTHKNEPGLVDNTGYNKSSIRLNIGQKFNDWLDLYVTTNYINSDADRGFFNNGNANRTVGYALAFTYPWEDLSPVDGAYPAGGAGSNALETVALTTNEEKVNRFIGSATTNIRLLNTDNQKLKLVLQGGFDQYTLRTRSIFPQALTYFRSPTSLGGVSIQGTTVNTNYQLSAFLVHNLDLDNGLSFTTQLGNFFQDFDRNTLVTVATGLNGSQTNLDQSTNVSTDQTIIPQQDTGFFGQTEINFEDKIIGTVGIRADKSTNNGDSDKFYYYPKANIAFNLHNFDFWNIDALSTFKPRVAYGEAGSFSNFRDRFTVFDGELIGGNSGLSPNSLLGNTEVGPERQKELEYGLDFGLFNNKINFEFTVYKKMVDDLLLEVNYPSSSGFTTKIQNAAELENRGIELGIDANVVAEEDFTWNTNIRWWKNKSEVTRLDVPSFTEGGFASSLGTFLIQEGKSATQIVGTYDADAYTAEEIAARDPEGDGFFVYGNAEPDFQMSWSNQLSYKNFDLSFLWHWKKGGDNINLTTLLYDLAGTTWDYDDTGIDPSGTLTNGAYRASQGFVNPDPFIEDAGYLRLREIGLYYTLPEGLVKYTSKIRVGISGRNLINIFDYNSYDPEVSNFGNNELGNNVEVTPYPASKFVNLHLNVNF